MACSWRRTRWVPARGYLYVPDGAMPAVHAALRARTGWDHIPIEVVRAPDAFVAGQESAVVAAIEGRPALPRDSSAAWSKPA